MKLLKTFIHHKHHYLECKYRDSYPTYWLNIKELDIWNTGMTEDFRKHIPRGYVYENT